MLVASNINKSFASLHVLSDVSLQVEPAEVVTIVGASGAGKTTLLQILGTLLRPDSGAIRFSLPSADGSPQVVDVTRLDERGLAQFRNRHIGFVFQSHQLLPELSAIDNVCLPALIAGTPLKQAAHRAHELLEFLHVDSRAAHKPAQLSGGEQQRVAVARALINNPTLVLADEPSGNLDSKNARELHDLFFALREQYGQTFIIVTHNTELAHVADRQITLIDGKNV